MGAHSAYAQDKPILTIPPLLTQPDVAMTPTSMQREGLIHLDVAVTDTSGKSVTGLTPNDFTLLDNGLPSRILSLREANQTDDDHERLTEVVLVLDEVNLSPVQAGLARRETIKFLRQNEGRLTCPVSLYHFTMGGVSASATPTTNGNALADDIARDRFPRSLWQIPLARAGDIDDLAQRRYLLWDKALQTIYTIAIERRDKPGRKLVVWMGFGWPVNLGAQQHRDNDFYSLVELSTRIREARMVICAVTDWSDPQEFNFAYTNYLTGIRSVSELEDSGIIRPYAHFALQVLAVQSGGLILDKSPDLRQAIEDCIQDAGSFYTLSFDPPHTQQVDEYHDLKVEVRTPGFSARTSTGYYNQPVFYDQPRAPLRRVTIHELEKILGADGKKHDAEMAGELNSLELTERLSTERLAAWKGRVHGRQSRSALTALADVSTFCNPPAEEVPPDPAPDHATQVEILTRTVKYLEDVLPALPDFSAIRTTVQYNQRPAKVEDTWKTARGDQSLHEGITEDATLLYRNGHEEQIVEKRKDSHASKRNLNLIGVFGPILDQVLRDATSGGNGLVWSQWERGEPRNKAVFRYTVQSKNPSWVVVGCCLRTGDVFRVKPEYHGELVVDPETGAVLRLTMGTELGWLVEPNLSPVRFAKATSMMVEYGPVEIGPKRYISPQRGVVSIRTRIVRPLKIWDQSFAVYAAYETLLQDVTYTKYHKFGSEARMLPGFESVPNETSAPAGTGNNPKSTPPKTPDRP
jgi:VWFA-related protein